STNLALIFGTLLSSQGTDASFVLTLSGFPPGFPSVFRVSSLADPFSVSATRWSGLAVSGICFSLSLAAGSNTTRLFRSPRPPLRRHAEV
ncbi:hypothetical protein ACFYV5_22470, partial [Streptomyces sp. NPDC003035]|uniref:hypothetical protein n=1 Tax=unclassified Streptomyces TaxID=2593676 RepID=UPI0033A9710B